MTFFKSSSLLYLCCILASPVPNSDIVYEIDIEEMSFFETWVYPDIPSKLSELLFQEDTKLVIVGVIGKSAFPDCNKMAGLNVLDTHPSHLNHQYEEGQIRFYYSNSESILFLHFQTTFDEYCMRGELFKEMKNTEPGRHLTFNKFIRNRFSRMLLFATQVCHIIVYVELSVTFDSSLMSILKALKIIRERHVLKFLPKLLKNSNPSTYLGKCARVCSPRCLFFFENYPEGYDKSEEYISKLEFEIEDNIYKMFRNEQIISNKSGTCLFSLPGNKRFVYYNTDDKIREDPLLKSLNDLQLSFEKSNAKDDCVNGLEELRPFGGFGKPLAQNPDMRQEIGEKKNDFMTFLKDHVKEALQYGFDESATKFKSKSNNVIPNVRTWYDTFEMFHKIFIENPDNPDFEAMDPSYKSYLENFDKLMDIDEGFFSKCCDIGVKKSCNLYNNPVLNHYGKSFHKALVDEALGVYMSYARGPNIAVNEQKLRENYEQCWTNGKQQSETQSVRPSTCTNSKPITKDNAGEASELISTCNCGRAQGWREDPYTVRQEKYEYCQIQPESCLFCVKNKKVISN